MIQRVKTEPEDVPDLGSCCCCGTVEHVHSLVLLDRKTPYAGTGWGCCVCQLPSDGAVAALCDPCAEAGREPRFAIAGYARGKRRIPVADLGGPHEHDLSRHPDARSAVLQGVQKGEEA